MTNSPTPALLNALKTATKLASDLDVPSEIAACYAVQAETVSAYAAHDGIGGGTPYGYKVGATNAGARKGLGAEAPFYGQLLSGGRKQSGDSFDYAAMGHAVAECEFAVELASDLPARDADYTVDEVKAATKQVMLSMEIVSTRFDSFPGAGVLRFICDNAAGGGWVAGAPIENGKDVDFNAVAVKLEKNGELVAEGSGQAIDDGPFGMLAWLANQGVGLKAGEIVTTGTATAPHPCAAGDKLVATFGDLGSVEVSFS